ncbi:hypothetical protein SAMN05444156_1090 [Verrucomicrobium sp. GAS474]|uniref:hypothetical protein n=1 Tax=Verrucomicrobium sp. GAS474 TaxID=1882831 RepID=UPI00087A0520|nr:hypothetical protein [Verrucomicrobium sp. GAS474]SDT96179.1 hypothetical protein SAMN05444156_1090 [Verrucomicrobium sp. GAS474]
MYTTPSEAEVLASRRLSRLKEAARVCGLLIVVSAIAVLIGWIYEDDFLKRISPSFGAMNPLTALAFVAAGIVLCRFSEEGKGSLLGRALAGFVLLVGVVKLLDYALGWEFHIDEILFRAQVLGNNVKAGNHLSPNTAAAFLLGGLALALLESRRGGRFSAWAQGFSLALLGIATISLIGYLYGQYSLYRLAGRSAMALHTSLCFALLALGVMLAQAEGGMVRLLSGTTAGGSSARRLLPVAVGLPILLGALRLWAAKGGWFSPEFGAACLIILFSTLFAFLTWRDAATLDRIERERREAEARLKQAHEEIDLRLRTLAAPLYAENEALRAEIARLKPLVKGG